MIRLTATLFALLAAATMQGALAATPAEIKDHLDGHNLVRRDHGASALTWSDTLASAAQRWVDGCKFQHSGGAVGPYGGSTLPTRSLVTMVAETHPRESGCWHELGNQGSGQNLDG